MKIYIDNCYNPANKETAEILYETGVRTAGILKDYGVEVVLSSPEDIPKTFSPGAANLHINQANEQGADLFVALNLNSSPDKFATGAGVAVYKPAPEVQETAEEVLNLLSTQTHLQNRGITQRSDCLPLKRAKMPAFVLDLGFITNKNDFDLITGHPELIADIVARGLAERIKQKRESPTLAETPEDNKGTKPAFYQLYPANRKGVCRLVVNVFTSLKPSRPIPDAQVTVFHGKDGKHMLIYRGLTNTNGSTIPVELPCFTDGRSNNPDMFCICVRHHGYMPKNQWIYVRGERFIRETVTLDERRIHNR